MQSVDWPGAIERNREALLRVVAALFVMAGAGEGAVLSSLPRYLRNQVLRILRPAESAVRRLIVIAARGVAVELAPSSDRGYCPGSGHGSRPVPRARRVEKEGVPSLPLLDPLKRFDLTPRRRYSKSFPRITCIGLSEPTPIPDDWFPSPDDEVDATCLCRRLAALQGALTDLDRQARRLVRWKARRDADRLRLPRYSPIRPGWPPGFRRQPVHAIDGILRDLHSLARIAWESPDTS